MDERAADRTPDPGPGPGRSPAAGGEVVPPHVRHLERPPSERYAPAASPKPLVESSPRGALAAGVAAAVVSALAWGLLAGVLDIQPGLLVVAIVVGWLVGAAVAWGAWRGVAHRTSPGVRLLGVAVGLVAWLAGQYVAYLVGLLLLPESSRSFLERVAGTPFEEVLAGGFLPFGPLELVLIALVAWRSAR